MPCEESKTVKKEEIDEEDEDEKPIGYKMKKNASTLKKEATKLNTPDSHYKPISAKPSKKPKLPLKKEASDDDFDDKPINPKTSNKTNKVQVKKNDKDDGKNKKGGKEAEKGTVKKKVQKVYDLPGQKREPPEERDPLRIFYETLYEQVPDSEMASIWMMESGLLPRDKAIKVLERKQKKAQQPKLSSPMKSVVTVKKGDSVTVKKKQTSTPKSNQTKKTPPSKVASQQSKKRKIQEDSEEEDSDDEFIAAPKKRKSKE